MLMVSPTTTKMMVGWWVSEEMGVGGGGVSEEVGVGGGGGGGGGGGVGDGGFGRGGGVSWWEKRRRCLKRFADLGSCLLGEEVGKMFLVRNSSRKQTSCRI
ncbi:keratin, type I cytoskeletal 13-like isoform X2 [Helianthus annuus]|uniref:keratin, type I cytoskeletal 13-like isoform X2 n=1 Tax=Helianthus annuus TaxID=4232 RepID=UPI001653194A|nr:keratin, type I cytoskeletal 13-like isoform X2 [Helianthus annuus]